MSSPLPELLHTSRHALAAIFALAQGERGERFSSEMLSERTGVPRPILAKVLVALSHAGLVHGSKGHGGGYRLARSADQIRLMDVVKASGAWTSTHASCALHVRDCNPAAPCALHDRWIGVLQPVADLLTQTTVAEALKRAPGDPGALFEGGAP